MILEGLLTTLNEDGRPNIAPMGPRVEGDSQAFVLRPFRTSTTYRNLKRTGVAVFHVVDDVLLLAKTAIGRDVAAETFPAESVDGAVLRRAVRYYELRVSAVDESELRASFHCEVAKVGRLGDFFGFNRAKHAVIEGAILATRLHLLPPEEIAAEFAKLRVIVGKTGGEAEAEAFALLDEYVASQVAAGPRTSEAR